MSSGEHERTPLSEHEQRMFDEAVKAIDPRDPFMKEVKRMLHGADPNVVTLWFNQLSTLRKIGALGAAALATGLLSMGVVFVYSEATNVPVVEKEFNALSPEEQRETVLQALQTPEAQEETFTCGPELLVAGAARARNGENPQPYYDAAETADQNGVHCIPEPGATAVYKMKLKGAQVVVLLRPTSLIGSLVDVSDMCNNMANTMDFVADAFPAGSAEQGYADALVARAQEECFDHLPAPTFPTPSLSGGVK